MLRGAAGPSPLAFKTFDAGLRYVFCIRNHRPVRPAVRTSRKPSIAITLAAIRSIHFLARRYISRGRLLEKPKATTVYQPVSIAKTIGGKTK